MGDSALVDRWRLDGSALAERGRLDRSAVDERTAAWLGVALGVTFGVCFATGVWSHLAQDPPPWFTPPARPESPRSRPGFRPFTTAP